MTEQHEHSHKSEYNQQPEKHLTQFECNDCEQMLNFVEGHGAYCDTCNVHKEYPVVSSLNCIECQSQFVLEDDGAYFMNCLNCGNFWHRKDKVEQRPLDAAEWARFTDLVNSINQKEVTN